MNKSNWIIPIIIVLVLIAGLGYFALRPTEGPLTSPEDIAIDSNETRVFNVEARNFRFDVPEMRVKQGDRVRINLTVTEGMHNWDLDEFNAKTRTIRSGESDSVEFIADKTGTFEYYCEVGNHRQMGMVGTLIVE